MRTHVLMLFLVISMSLPCLGGTVLRELWMGAHDMDEAEEVMRTTEPDVVDILDESIWQNYGDNYIGRMSGWVNVPETGVYQFHVASDDNSRLYVSQDENPDHAEMVAYVDGWTGGQEWNKFPETQHSDDILLRKGQVIAIYANMQEGTGGDNLAIGWTGPGLSDDPAEPNFITNWVTHLGPNLALARYPEPEDEEEDVPLDVTLAWTPGDYVGTHNVYLGTDFNEVNEAGLSSELLIEQGLDVNHVSPDGLELGMTYYWRIDEVNASDGSVDPGQVWSFSSEPVGFPVENIMATASSSAGPGPERTVDGSGLDDNQGHSYHPEDMWMSGGTPGGDWLQYEFDAVYRIHQMRVWNYNDQSEPYTGVGAKEVKIEISVDGQAWEVLAENVQFNQAPGAASYGANTTVDFNGAMIKFVKLTLLNNWGGIFPLIGLSEVQFLYEPLQARRPEPASGGPLKSLDDILVWRSGRYAVQHDLYLSGDQALVEAGDTSVLVASPTQRRYGLGGVSTLYYGQRYYWRVDEINAGDVPERTAGEVWSFDTPISRSLDDMESYTSDGDPWIFEVWVDGFEDQGDDNSSQVGLDDPPYVERDIALGGLQSMPFYYDNRNASMFAEAVMSVDHQDWTRGGIETLVLYMLGDRANEGGSLYVEINNARVTFDADLNLGLWKQWNIDMSSFATDLTDVTSITIGVDGTGNGLVYIDEISLYRTFDPPIVPQAPDSEALALWYDMEGDVDDGSGNGHHGSPAFTPRFDDDLESLGESMYFDGLDQDVEMPIGSLVAGLSDCAFASWVQIDLDSEGVWQRVFDVGTGEENTLYLSPRAASYGPPTVGIIAESIGTEVSVKADDNLLEGWHHLAVVFEGDILSLYVDGWLAESVVTDTLPKDLGQTTQNWLGRSQSDEDDFFNGLLDEFRIYDQALTVDEVRYLAGDR